VRLSSDVESLIRLDVAVPLHRSWYWASPISVVERVGLAGKCEHQYSIFYVLANPIVRGVSHRVMLLHPGYYRVAATPT